MHKPRARGLRAPKCRTAAPTSYCSSVWILIHFTLLAPGILESLCTPAVRFHLFYSADAAEVACWPLVPKFAGSHPAEAVGFLGRKNPQHAFLRRGSKAMEITWESSFQAKFVGHFSPISVPRYRRALMSLDVERL